MWSARQLSVDSIRQPLRDGMWVRETHRVPRGRLRISLAIVAAFAVAGWIWALSSDDMPDAVWLLTVVLSMAAVGLAVYALIRGRRRGASERRY